MDNLEYTTLVLSGNSTNAVVVLGALQYLYETNRLTNIRKYVGTSSGALISALLCVGYEPIEILSHICSDDAYVRIARSLSLSNFVIGGRGVLSYDPIGSTMEKLLRDRVGDVKTLKDLGEKCDGKIIVCVAFDMTRGKRAYINRLENPNMPISIALRMTTAFPFIFEPCQFEGSVYVDGGLVDNFPIEYAQRNCSDTAEKCIGVMIRNPHRSYSVDMGIVQYAQSLMSAFVDANMSDKIDHCTKESLIIQIRSPACFFAFDATNANLVSMFDEGSRTKEEEALLACSTVEEAKNLLYMSHDYVGDDETKLVPLLVEAVHIGNVSLESAILAFVMDLGRLLASLIDGGFVEVVKRVTSWTRKINWHASYDGGETFLDKAIKTKDDDLISMISMQCGIPVQSIASAPSVDE